MVFIIATVLISCIYIVSLLYSDKIIANLNGIIEPFSIVNFYNKIHCRSTFRSFLAINNITVFIIHM